MPFWKGIAVHHSAIALDGQPQINRIERAHKARGFDDIGYHWLIDQRDGRFDLVGGRSSLRHGSHAKGHNNNLLGLCIVGNHSENAPPQEQLRVAAEAIVMLARMLIPRDPAHPLVQVADLVLPHRELPGAATECPGELFGWPEFLQLIISANGGSAMI